MAQTQTFNGRRRVRKFFGKIPEVAEMPNLIEVQKASYDQFLMVDEPEGGRPDEGLQAVFKSVFPVSDFSGAAMLEFVKYEFEPPKFDVEECRQRDLTYSAPLKVTLRLIVFDIDEDTQAKSIKDIKEQDVYMGDMPLMTDNGTFIINGTERVIVSQMHRSPGVFFDHDKGKSHSSGKLLFAARVIPYRGSWLDIEFDSKDIVHARIDRRRKIPATSLLMALGMDAEDILSTFYDKLTYVRDGDSWRIPFSAERFRGMKAVNDMIDADSGEVVVEAGKKITVRQARQLGEKGLKAIRATEEDLLGNYLAEDIVNHETGEIYLEAGDEIDEKTLKVLLDTARHIKHNGGRVRINTDGLANLVHKRNVLPEMADCIDSLSVSMNAQDEAVYRRHCAPALPGSYAAMLDFLAAAPAYIGDVTATAIDGLDGVDIARCEALADHLGVAFRRRELDVVG